MKILFRQTFFNCLPTNCVSFPDRNSREMSEKPNEPDNENGPVIYKQPDAVPENADIGVEGKIFDIKTSFFLLE